MPTHHTLDSLAWTEHDGWQQAVIDLPEGETVDNPASTKGPIYGPATVTFDRYQDGGIRVMVSDLTPPSCGPWPGKEPVRR